MQADADRMGNVRIVMHNTYLILLYEALFFSRINSLFQLFIYNVNIYKLVAMNQAVVISLSLASDQFKGCSLLDMKQSWVLFYPEHVFSWIKFCVTKKWVRSCLLPCWSCHSRQDLGQIHGWGRSGCCLGGPTLPKENNPKGSCSRDSTDQVLIVYYLLVILLLQTAISCALGNLLSLQLYHLLGTSLH